MSTQVSWFEPSVGDDFFEQADLALKEYLTTSNANTKIDAVVAALKNEVPAARVFSHYPNIDPLPSWGPNSFPCITIFTRQVSTDIEETLTLDVLAETTIRVWAESSQDDFRLNRQDALRISSFVLALLHLDVVDGDGGNWTAYYRCRSTVLTPASEEIELPYAGEEGLNVYGTEVSFEWKHKVYVGS